MLSIHCPSCGGTNIFDETKQIPTYCAFCSAHLPDMTKFVQDSLKLGLDTKRHTMQLETMDKEIKKERVKTSTEKLRLIIILILTILGLLVALLPNLIFNR